MHVLSSVSCFRLLHAAAAVGLCFCGVACVIAGEPVSSSSQQLLDALQLDEPFFDEGNRSREPGDERGTLEAWRNVTIDRLRAVDLSSFEFHAYQISSRQIRLADFLVGRLSEADYEKQDHGPDFLDQYGFRTAGNHNATIDWLATSPDAFIREKSQYGQFGFAVPLAAAFWQTGDPAYLRKWFAIAADFAQKQRQAVEALPPGKRRMDNAPWLIGALPCLHQGDRVIAMVRCLAVFAKSLPAATDGSKPDWGNVLRPVDAPADPAALAWISADELAAVVHSLAIDHPKLLLDFYYQPGAVPNQRFLGLTALLMLATVFPDMKGMDEVARKASDAVAEYLENGFHQDGGMLEQSLNYNVGQAEQCRQLGRLLRPNPPRWLPLLAQRLRDFDRLIVGISTPMRELPVVGNNTSNPPAAWTGEEVRSSWFSRKPGDTPQIDTTGLGFGSIAFPYSGFYAQRRDWGWDSPYLFMTNARPTRGHQSMDNLAIEVHAYGRPLLVRGGPPPYGLKFVAAERRADLPKIEEYFNEHSSYKLNTVIVDGHSQKRSAPLANAAYETPVDGRWHATAAFDIVDGTYSLGYGLRDDALAVDFSVSHQRRVIHVRELSCWVVTDTMISKDDRQHDFTQVWKFPPFRDANDGASNPTCGFTPEQVTSGDGSIRTLDPNGPNLWLYQFSGLPIAYSKHVGETDPYRGWYARYLGDLIPAVDMHATWRARGRSVVTTLLWPTPGGSPPPIKSFTGDRAAPAQDTSTFSVTLKDGATMALAESASGPRWLQAGGISILGETILVTRQGRSVRGLVLGCTEWTDGRYKIKPKEKDFEFVCRAEGGFDVVAPIGTPRGFRWDDGGRGIVPDYAETTKAAPVRTENGSTQAVKIAEVSFPETVRSKTTGHEVPVSGLCGVAWLGGDRYVAAPRQGGHLIAFRMPLDNGGNPRAILEAQAVPGGGPSRKTDVAFDTIQQRMLVVDDSPPAMHAIRLDDASASESLDIPAVQRAAREGKGLAAITTDPATGSVWVSNREALILDGLPAIGSLGTDVRLMELGAESKQDPTHTITTPKNEWLYQVDAAHEGRKLTPGDASSGVSAIAAIGDGRLLVLETSRAPTLPRFRNRLFLVDPRQTVVSGSRQTGRMTEGLQAVSKRLLWEQAGGTCLEGLCLGPTLGNGDRIIVAVGDNSSLGTPTSLVVLRWSPDDRRASLAWAGWWVAACAAACGTLVLWRVAARSPFQVSRGRRTN